MIFCELSKAAFRFSLQQPVAEIMGAFKRPPPPSRRWKIQRPSRARVKLGPNLLNGLLCKVRANAEQNLCSF